ncbi:hypothetical protein [Janibacter terrae]|uniref:hypothetical protein n=1 Tax=Janibacter terrae TaxID=103817 RepID=UPI000AF9A552|nr:hypothetical protein [Janibacter terrae]
MSTQAPLLPGHAPGWSSRKGTAGAVEQPWDADLPARVYGLCESGWHHDCPQAPLLVAVPGCCACPCHTPAGAA